MSTHELHAYSTWLGAPKVAPCPRCGTRLRWRANDWWLAHAGALVILGGALGLLATVVQWIMPDSVAGFVGAMLVGSVIALFAVIRLRLVRTDGPQEEK